MPVFPVPIFKGLSPKISDRYGASRAKGPHAGSDIMYRRPAKGATKLPNYSPNYFMPNDVPALAFDDGTVTKAGQIGTGGRIQISHANGLSTKYYHLRNVRVNVGDRVTAGQPIADIYHNVAGYKLNHLHFEAFQNGKRINPEPLMAKSQMVPVPSQAGFVLKIAGAVAAGLLLSKYVFK